MLCYHLSRSNRFVRCSGRQSLGVACRHPSAKGVHKKRHKTGTVSSLGLIVFFSWFFVFSSGKPNEPTPLPARGGGGAFWSPNCPSSIMCPKGRFPATRQGSFGVAFKNQTPKKGTLQKRTHTHTHTPLWSLEGLACWDACQHASPTRPRTTRSSTRPSGKWAWCLWVVGRGCQNRCGIPFWGIGEFATRFKPILVV